MTRRWLWAGLIGLLAPILAMGQDLEGEIWGEIGPGELHVVGDCSIPSDCTLVMSAGTTLLFMGPYELEVRGDIQALGADEERICFTVPEGGAPWGGIDLINADSSTFAWCEFYHGLGRQNPPGSYGGAVYMNNAAAVFDHCTFMACEAERGGAVYAYNSTVTLTYCVFDDNEAQRGGGIYISNSDYTIQRSIFEANSAAWGGGIEFFIASGELTHCSFLNNDATHGADLYLGASSLQLTHSILFQSLGTAIECGLQGTLLAEYNCLFASGEFFEGEGLHPGLGRILRVNANGDSCDFFYNIYLDPRLAPWRGPNRELYLLADSPCIDAGDPESPTDPDGSIADLGAYPFDPASATAPESQPELPGRFAIRTVYPNPFNGRVTVSFSTPRREEIQAEIFSITGQLVDRIDAGMVQAGRGSITWRPGADVSSGVYLLRLTADKSATVSSARLLFVK